MAVVAPSRCSRSVPGIVGAQRPKVPAEDRAGILLAPAPEPALKLPLINSPRAPRALARATIDDDRSPPRRVPLWSPWRDEAETGAPVHDEVSKMLHQRVSTGFTESVRPETAVIFIVGPLLLTAGIVLVTLWNLHWTAGLPLGLFSCLPALAAANWLALRRNAREVRAILLARGYCASCGYGLAEIPAAPHADGLTTCPECGAAWRLDVSKAPPQAEGLERK